jgi:hypothetical protein
MAYIKFIQGRRIKYVYMKWHKIKIPDVSIGDLVGVDGFEPPTLCL